MVKYGPRQMASKKIGEDGEGWKYGSGKVWIIDAMESSCD